MKYSFNTAGVRPSERFDFFHEAVAKSYIRSEHSVPDYPSFRANIELVAVANLHVSMIEISPLHSSIPRLSRETSVPEIAFVLIVLEGHTRVVQDGREVEARAGQMSLLDTARPYTVDIPEGAKNLVLEMPRAELAARIGPIENATGRPYSTRTSEGMLAARYLSQLFANPQSDATQSITALARQALDVTALALSRDPRETVRRLSSPAAVSRLRLHHVIETTLSVCPTSCDDVANMAGISARYANMLLAQEGTSLERLIMRRRLEQCCSNLSDPAMSGRAIGDIARSWGFASASHFSRAFREVYGMTARDYRYRNGTSSEG